MTIRLTDKHSLDLTPRKPAVENEQASSVNMGKLQEILDRAGATNGKDAQEEYVPPEHKKITASPTESSNDVIRRRILEYGKTVAAGCLALGDKAMKDTEEFTESISNLMIKRMEEAQAFQKSCAEAAELAIHHATEHAEHTAKGNDRLKRIFDAASE